MSSNIVEVCVIEELTKHPNADTLEIAKVKGWYCIVKMGQQKVGDKVVYIPPDSVVTPEFVEKYKLDYLKDGGGVLRIRSVKLRGVLSQGLILPAPIGANVGQNMAQEWNIVKWEPPVPEYQQQGKNPQSTRNRPNRNFAVYTDIENIKHFPGLFEGLNIVITEKIHGTNFRCGWVERDARNWWQKLLVKLFGQYEWVIGSHNVQLTIATPKHAKFYKRNIYTEIAERLKLKEIIPKGCTIYGEIFGDGVQDLTYGLKNNEIDVRFFDLKVDDRYVDFPDFHGFCNLHSLPFVPVLYEGPYYEGVIETCTDGKSVMPGAEDQIREGCVTKPIIEVNHPRCGRLILKSVSTICLTRKGGTEFH